MNETTADLMEWVKEYAIDDEIRAILDVEGFDAALAYIRLWFDGWGEAEAIMEQFT